MKIFKKKLFQKLSIGCPEFKIKKKKKKYRKLDFERSSKLLDKKTNYKQGGVTTMGKQRTHS